MFSTLVILMISRVCAYDQIHQDVNSKCVQFVVKRERERENIKLMHFNEEYTRMLLLCLNFPCKFQIVSSYLKCLKGLEVVSKAFIYILHRLSKEAEPK